MKTYEVYDPSAIREKHTKLPANNVFPFFIQIHFINNKLLSGIL